MSDRLTVNDLCFVTEANYPRYAERAKQSILKSYLDRGLDKRGIPFFISTNCPSMFSEYLGNSMIRVFDVEQLRMESTNGDKTAIYESLPNPPPPQLYPSKYPWNIRRFVVRKAASQGYKAVFQIEADCLIPEHIDTDAALTGILESYEPNTVKTNTARFVYATGNHKSEMWQYHSKYISDLRLNIPSDQLDTLDGWSQLFMGNSSSDLVRLVDTWDFLTLYGYEQKDRYGNGWLSNLSFAIPMAGFTLIHQGLPIVAHHHYEDRY